MLRWPGFALCSLALAGCASPPTTPALTGGAAESAARAKHGIYWTFFSNQTNPQLQTASLPLSKRTKPANILGDARDMLKDVCCVRIYQGMIWVLAAPSGSANPNELLIFRSPLKTRDFPLYYDTLESSNFAVHLEFDGHGNLWVSSLGTNRANPAVYEYAAGSFFQQGAVLAPALTLNTGLTGPQGLGFDNNGNLYVADSKAGQIAVFEQPIQNQQPYYLEGISNPGGLVFDNRGNLFAASNIGATGAIVEYPSTDLHSGDKPKVVDTRGIKANPYGSDLEFDSAGNLYDGDCGNSAGIYAYALSLHKFRSRLAPSFYTNSTISMNGCVWSIAIQ
ncbi:MAG: hypothetical protein JO113_09755 [Candidatus Eremiobacteraeota bacterium]|nr:hypothetical protein [Candidatus Eremiobacteraeota bacterium]